MSIEELEKIAKRIRIETIKSLYAAQSGHPGSALGIVDVLTALYFAPILKHDPSNPQWEERDYFLLSNGHAVPGLYAALAVAGYYPVDKLSGLRQIGTPLHGHPKRGTFPGIELSSGSLGMGLSVGVGRALGLKLAGKKNKVYVMMSDGEQEEGSTWEAFMFAPAASPSGKSATTSQMLAGKQAGRPKYKLDNLVAIVDDNESQINGPTTEIMPALYPLADKYRAFHWEVVEIDGNDMGQILEALAKAQKAKGPFVIISNTIIGKGVSFMEGDWRWHHGKLSDEEYKIALNDLKS